MEYTTLGRTGLKVSVAGLGCGGNSRLGLGHGASEASCVALVRVAYDEGVNFLDTAAGYGTEVIVGRAAQEIGRNGLVISTKALVRQSDGLQSGAQILESLEASLGRLQTDYVDVFHLHAVQPDQYDHAVAEILPTLMKAKEAGKLRHIGITESSPNDHGQSMLQRALPEGHWDVAMFAFHMLCQGARRRVFPLSMKHGVGTLLMFVVRNIFSRPGLLTETVKGLIADGKLPADLAVKDNPLDFLVHEGGAASIIDAAYRFARHEPGADVVLFGTGDVAHLKTNIASILAPPLPSTDVARLTEVFGHLEGIGLVLPDRVKKLP